MPFSFSKLCRLNSIINVKRNGEIIGVVNCGCDNHFVHMFEYVAEFVRESRVEVNRELILQAEIRKKIRI